MRGREVAAAAAAVATLGAGFRVHGRDPANGLDCVGLVAHALAVAGWRGEVPTGYALRSRDADVASLLDARLARADGTLPGDVLLFAPGAGQLHLAIRSERGVIHADAGLRRVVERPGPVPWLLIGAWRLGGPDERS